MRLRYPLNNLADCHLRIRQHRHRGAAIIYLTLCMPFMILMTSLAVDYGRAQTAKSQLQAAVDAAARVAAQDMVNQQTTSTASTDAAAVALQNKVDGQSLVLRTTDIVFGTWSIGSSTFTANTSSPNAVQITGYRNSSRSSAIPTIWAAVMGSASVNVHATAIAYISQGIACFNALGNVTFNDTGLANGGTWATDSYYANNGSYSNVSAGGQGDLLTNGNVTYNFVTPPGAGSGLSNMITSEITGQIYSANGANCAENWSEQASGGGTYWIQYGATDDPGPSTTAMSSAATFPTPVMPQHNTNPSIPNTYLSGSYSNGLQDLTVSDGSLLILPGGTYDLNSLNVTNGSTVEFSGAVTLNIATNVNINAAAIEPSSSDPKYMVINCCNTTAAGTNSVTINNPTQPLYADLNAPLADFNFTQPNNGNGIYGRVYSNNFTVNSTGNGGFHADQSLNISFHIVK